MSSQSIITKIWSRPGWVKRIIAWLRKYSLHLAIAAVILSLIVFLSVASYFYMTSPQTVAVKQAQKAYLEQLNNERSTDVFKRAWQRLQSKHGYPAAVIYEPGKTPYYYDKEGRESKFI